MADTENNRNIPQYLRRIDDSPKYTFLCETY